MVLVLGTAAIAAQQKTDSSGAERSDLDEIRKISSLIGTDVVNRTNTTTAKIRDLVLSSEGRVIYGILGCGGLAGVGERYTAIPWEWLDVHHVNGKWVVNLEMTTESLKQAPAIETENYRELTDPQWMTRVDQFFRPQARDEGRAPGEANAPADQRTGTTAREPRPLEVVLLATKIRGAKLKNAQNEDLGVIDDLLLDRMHRVAFVIVGQGGVLGIGESFIPVPWSSMTLRYNRENSSIIPLMDVTKTQLERAPLVKASNFATLLAPGFAEQVRRYFGAAGRE
jgi:hypothetical protein